MTDFTLENFTALVQKLLNLDKIDENNIRKLVILSIRKSDPANKDKESSFLLREIEKYDCHQTSLLAKKKTKLIIDIEKALGLKLSDDDAVKAQTVEGLFDLFTKAKKQKKQLTSSTTKKDFPFFENNNLVYLDSAATTQKPKLVIDTIANFYTTSCANINRSSYPLASRVSEAFERCRASVASFINTESERVFFTKGTTESINIVARSLEETKDISKKNIVISQMEHSSNRLPWERLSKKTGCELRIVKITEKETLDSKEFEKLTDKNTVLVSVTGMSNINGFKPDIKTITKQAKEKGSLVLIDAAQLIAHNKIDIKEIGCDFLCFSGHKIYGPMGTGVLYCSKYGENSIVPLILGGGYLEKDGLYLESGTQDIAGILGLEKALSYLKEEFFAKEIELADLIIEKLRSFPNIRVFASEHSPVISFVSDKVSTDFIAKHLFEDSIALRTGSNCAPWMLNQFNLNSVCRLSLGIYTDESDARAFLKSMEVLNLKAHNFT